MVNSAPPSAPGLSRVGLKSTASGLVLSLPSGQTFEAIRTALRDHLSVSPERYRGVTLRLDLGEGQVSLFDLRRVLHVLKDEFGAEVVGVHCTVEALQRYAEKELKLKVHVAAPVEAVPEAPKPAAEDAPTLAPSTEVTEIPTEILAHSEIEETDDLGERVMSIHGTVRSGAVVDYKGDVTVFGDVNPGAQIIAGGNIVVLGALKGFAHAGARRNDSFILAFDMKPTQLRIGKVIQLSSEYVPERGRTINPEIAWISGGSIVVEPYRGRLPGLALKEVS